MNRSTRARCLVLPVLLIATSACRLWGTTRSEEMHTLGSALTKLAAGVEAYVVEKDPPAGMDDQELIVRATDYDPGLRAPFEDYRLRVMYQDRHAVLLVCDKDGMEGLLEDAGCTARLDEHKWSASPPKVCEFSLSIREACGGDATPAQP